MTDALPFASADDPRLAPLVAAVLRRAKIEESWADTVTRVATGETKASELRCCGSDCRPCVQDLFRCSVDVLRAYNDETVAKSLLRRGLRGRVRGRVTGLARRVTKIGR